MIETSRDTRTIFFCVALATLPPLPALAEEGAAHAGPNILEFSYGVTFKDHHDERETAPSVSVAYRYAFSDRISAGLLGEYVTDPFDATIIGVPIVFHVGEGWQLTAMPGAEFEDSNEEFLLRAGVGYEFETRGGVGLKPEINVDMVDGEFWVEPALSIAFRF